MSTNFKSKLKEIKRDVRAAENKVRERVNLKYGKISRYEDVIGLSARHDVLVVGDASAFPMLASQANSVTSVRSNELANLVRKGAVFDRVLISQGPLAAETFQTLRRLLVETKFSRGLVCQLISDSDTLVMKAFADAVTPTWPTANLWHGGSDIGTIVMTDLSGVSSLDFPDTSLIEG